MRCLFGERFLRNVFSFSSNRSLLQVKFVSEQTDDEQKTWRILSQKEVWREVGRKESRTKRERATHTQGSSCTQGESRNEMNTELFEFSGWWYFFSRVKGIREEEGRESLSELPLWELDRVLLENTVSSRRTASFSLWSQSWLSLFKSIRESLEYRYHQQLLYPLMLEMRSADFLHWYQKLTFCITQSVCHLSMIDRQEKIYKILTFLFAFLMIGPSFFTETTLKSLKPVVPWSPFLIKLPFIFVKKGRSQAVEVCQMLHWHKQKCLQEKWPLASAASNMIDGKTRMIVHPSLS